MTDGLTIECYDAPVEPSRQLKIHFAFRLSRDERSTEMLVSWEDERGVIGQRVPLRLPLPVRVIRVRRDGTAESRRPRKASQKADEDRRENSARRIATVGE